MPTKTKTPTEIVESLGEALGVNDWGSCQYTGALNMFNALEILTKKHGKKKTFTMLGITVMHKGIVPLKTAWKEFQKEMTKRADEIYEDDKDPWCVKQRKDVVDFFVDNKPSVENMFECCRSESWDLWGAAPYIANKMFKDLKLGAPTAPGVGPLFNAIVQQENYATGLYCWLLCNEGLVEDTSAFAGFDT